MGRQREGMIPTPRRQTFEENRPKDTLISDSGLQNCEEIKLLSEAPGPWHLVLAALVGE